MQVYRLVWPERIAQIKDNVTLNRDPATEKSEKLLTANFVLLCASSLLFYLSFHILLPTLPTYVKEMGGSTQEIGMIIGAFATSALICRLPVGWILDRRGAKGLIIAGTAMFLISSVLYNFASTVPLLLAIRLLHGAGMAACNTASATLVAHTTPENRRGEAMGIFGAAANVSMALGPVGGIAVLSMGGYQQLFLVSAILAFGGLLLALPLRDYDASAIQSTRGLGLSAFYSREALFPSLVIFTVCLSYGLIVAFLPLFTIDRNLGNPGIFFLYYAILLAVSRGPVGRLSDKYGRAAIITPGMALLVVSMLVLSQTETANGLKLAAIAYGLGSACVHSTLMALAVDRVSLRDRGIAMGTFTAGWELGIALGSFVFGYILAASNYEMMFFSAAAVTVAGGVLFLLGCCRPRGRGSGWRCEI